MRRNVVLRESHAGLRLGGFAYLPDGPDPALELGTGDTRFVSLGGMVLVDCLGRLGRFASANLGVQRQCHSQRVETWPQVRRRRRHANQHQ